MALRAVGSIAAMVTVYYLLPLDGRLSVTAGVLLGLVLVAFVVLGTQQVRSILRAPYPVLRATVVLASLIPLFILVFASYYYVVEQQVPSSFSEPLSHTDALYFTVTVLATVGFGDIAPTTEAARIAVTVQMVADLVVLGLLIRTAARAATHSLGRQDGLGGASPAAGDAAVEVPTQDR
jgi:hypothetical protein